ncbi:hypothetical protein JHS3_20480 [Jeongeupia sp. HS-3]|uniref:flagella assembly protein FlgT middle domain-containing protein n=1 Tax=Jeongeupia sp. HS-3 TaxID=1009682 RepID=UPI0018A62C63|nr:flagella assembly protein FlgT middle domain-containing protein [Jeongeupia sp. HS-3]BCL76312.1 hypothetical protein JHS3_20480 [Jeongeupia sp. HS-3]
MSLARCAAVLVLLHGAAQAADEVVVVTPLDGAQLAGQTTGQAADAELVPTSPVASAAPAEPKPKPAAVRAFKRTVLVTPFVVRMPGQIADMPQFLEGTQDILRRRLDIGGRLIARTAPGEGAFALQPGSIDVQWRPERVRELARRFGTQFVVGGVVDDASTEGERYMPTAGRSLKPGERKVSVELPIVDFFGLGLKARPAARHFDATLYLFDGVSGALIGRYPLQSMASGDVLGDPRQAVAGAGFTGGDYGAVVASQLGAVADVLAEKIRCQPFSARVVGLSRGQVVLDAGTASGLRPGDTLQLYRLRNGVLPVDSLNLDPAQRLGMIEDRDGVLTVAQIQPLISLATMHGQQPEVGDYARWDGAEH